MFQNGTQHVSPVLLPPRLLQNNLRAMSTQLMASILYHQWASLLCIYQAVSYKMCPPPPCPHKSFTTYK